MATKTQVTKIAQLEAELSKAYTLLSDLHRMLTASPKDKSLKAAYNLAGKDYSKTSKKLTALTMKAGLGATMTITATK